MKYLRAESLKHACELLSQGLGLDPLELCLINAPRKGPVACNWPMSRLMGSCWKESGFGTKDSVR